MGTIHYLNILVKPVKPVDLRPCLFYVVMSRNGIKSIFFFLYFLRHVASFLSVFKLLVIGLIIIGRDPFALLGMQAPGIWEWGQGNKVRFNKNLCKRTLNFQVSRCYSQCDAAEHLLAGNFHRYRTGTLDLEVKESEV